MRHVRKNRRATLPHDVIRHQLEQPVDNYKEKDIILRFAVHKPFITKMNAHLRVQWCKHQRHQFTEVWKK